jgi:hypothetical protein
LGSRGGGFRIVVLAALMMTLAFVIAKVVTGTAY